VIELADAEVPAFFQTTRFSPHQLGLADVLATLMLTGEAPRSVTLVGVVPLDLDLGIDLSPEIAAVVGVAVERLVAELRGLGLAIRPRAPACSLSLPALLAQ
jgi:hydrogenase maturation protease